MNLEKIRTELQTKKLDAIIISQPENRRYLSGFTGSAGQLFITANQQYILTDWRYYERVKQEAPEWILIEAGYYLFKKLGELVSDLNLSGGKIGFEADYLTVSQFNKLQKELAGVALIETENIVQTIRAAKTQAELATIKKAVALADKALDHIYEIIQPGMTEKEAAWKLEVFIRTNGADALAFEIIVAAGPNTAMPHATPTDSPINLGEVVLIDMGCVINGYCSDITRTFSLGEPDNPKFREIWRLVNKANKAAIKGIKAGIAGDNADALARDIIKNAGYGDNFGHGLGHGIGLAIHELPKVSYTTKAPLISGAVVTIEPGIYLPGQFGVRLEDAVIVKENGAEVLSAARKIAVLPR